MKKLLQIWMFVVCAIVTGVAQTDSCVITSLPQFWDFETGNIGGTANAPLPACWHSIYTPGPLVITYDNAVSGVKVLVLKGAYDCLVLPPIDTTVLSVNDLQLSFYACRTGASYLGINDCRVGVMSDPLDPSTFVAIDTLTTLNNSIQPFDIPLSSYSGNGRHIAFRYYGGAGYYHRMYVDDLRIQFIPNCQRPWNLQITDLQSHSARLSWEASADSASYIVHYKSEIDSVWHEVTTGVLGTAEYLLTNLEAGSHYQCYVTATCYPDAASNTVTFTTNCASIVSVPQSWDFEHGLTVESYPIPLCWSRCGSSTPAHLPHVVNDSVFPAHFGVMSLITESDDITYAILPQINTDSLNINSLQISFYVTGMPVSEDDSYSLTIGVMNSPNNSASFTPVQQISGYSLGSYQHYSIPFDNYSGSGSYIAVRCNGACVLDDIILDVVPNCPEPSNLVVDSVTETYAHLSWVGFNVQENNFTLHYKSISDTNWTSLSFSATNPQFTLFGLKPSTSYEAYLVSNCLPDMPSNIIGFTTACAALCNVPQMWNFDYHYTVPVFTLPKCWDKDFATVFFDTVGACSNDGCIRFPIHSDSHLYPPTVVLPLINTDSLTIQNLQLSFGVRQTSNLNFPAELMVGILEPCSGTDSITAIQTIAHISNQYQRFDIPFDTYSGNGSRIIIQYASTDPTYTDFSIDLDNVILDTVPDCSRPSALSASHLTAHSVSLNWVDGGEVNAPLLLYYHNLTDTDWTCDTILSDNHTWVLNGLSASSSYEIYLAAYCDSSLVSNMIVASTLCEGMTTMPQIWDFEGNNSAGTGENPLPECWNRTNYCNPMVAFDTNANAIAYSGSHALRFFHPDQSIASLPAIDTNALSINGLMLSFYAKTTAIDNNCRIIVGVMSDPMDASTFTVVDTISGLLTEYQSFDVPLDSFIGQGCHVAIQTCFTDGNSLYLDDVKLQTLPDCDRPSDILLTYVDMTTAILSWSHDADSTWYVVAYKPVDGDTVFYDTTGVISEPAVSLNGLTANTTYEVRVAASCYQDAYSEPFTFTTVCNIIESLPQFWDFEANNTGGTTSRPLPACWTSVASPSSTGGSPYIYNYAGMTHSGNYSLDFWQSRGWYVVLPVLADSLQANDLGLSFWWKVSGKWNTCTSSALTVGVMTDPADVSTFTALHTLTTTDTLFHFEDVSLSTYLGTGKYIAFFDATPVGASGASDIYIDDLSLEYAPACPRPTDLTLVNLESRTANVVWISNADSTDYVVFYRPVAGSAGWFSDTVVGAAYTLQDLIPNTTYEVYVIALCSPWSQSSRITFRTDCAPDIIAVPQTWDFEELTTGYHVPICWSRYVSGSSASCPYIGTGYPYSGAQALYFFSSSGNIAIMPYVNSDYLDIRELQISFYIGNRRGEESPDATMEVGVISNPNDPSSFTSIQVIDSVGTEFKYVTVPFYSYTGDGKYIAFRDNNPNPNVVNKWYSIYIDDLTIDYCDSLPCAVPYHPVASDITDTSVTVSWGDAQHDPKTYLLCYKPSAGTQWQVDTVYPGVLTHTLMGLDYGTAYDCYVVALCNPDMPSCTTHFKTECFKITEIPASWDFNDFAVGPTLSDCWGKISETSFPEAYLAGGGNVTLRFKQTCIAYMPVIDTQLTQVSDLVLSFKAKASHANTDAVLEVGILSDPTDITTFSLIQTISGIPTNFSSYTIPLNTYSGEGAYIAFRHSGGLSYFTIIDDVTLQYNDSLIDGVEDYGRQKTGLMLYPNPAYDYVDVRVTDENVRIIGIEVYDIYGKVVRTVVGANDYLPTYRINLSGLSNGIYIAHIRTKTGIIDLKFVKKR
ncbi:MAG: fibronectin type III domain-containing protein [Bacteroidales bacterium]|nr:fibronectin type III domain-containing protein [Bacteroidales bacterium]